MRQALKTVFAMCLLALVVLLPSKGAQAVSAPGNVSKVSVVKLDENAVTLKWTAVARADGYYVYMQKQTNKKLGKRKKIGVTSSTSCEIKNLALDQKYKFTVYAYRKSGKTVRKSAKAATVTAKTKEVQVSDSIKLRVGSYIDKGVILKWNQDTAADGYLVFQKDPGSENFKKIGKATTNTFTVKKLEKGKTYEFKIRSFHSYNGEMTYSAFSNIVSAKAKAIDMSNVHGRYWNATVNSDCTVTLESSGSSQNISRGTSVIMTESDGNKATIKLKNGKLATIAKSKLNVGTMNWTSKYYSAAQAEAFVNSRGYTSETDYLIWISQYTCAVYAFKGSKGEWKMVRKMPCVVGRKDALTPTKEYTYMMRGYNYGDVFLFIAYFGPVTGGYGFHTNRVGGTKRGAVSGGCIRMEPTDLHWMDSHLKLNTKVISY